MASICPLNVSDDHRAESDPRNGSPTVSKKFSLANLRKATKEEEKIKSAAPSALVSADPPERDCGITMLAIKQQEPRPAV